MRSFPLLTTFVISAVLASGALTGCGKRQAELQVKVLDAATGGPVAGAVVEVDYQREKTNAAGVAHMFLEANTLDLRVEHKAYLPVASTVTLYPGMTALKTVSLDARPAEPSPSPSATPSPAPSGAAPQPTPSPSATPKAQVVLFGRVTDDHGTRLNGAYVFVESPFMGIPFGSASTNKVGEYKVSELPLGKAMRVTAIADGYRSVTRVVTPTSEWRLDFTGAYGLKPQAADPATSVRVSGTIEDTRGRALDGVMVKVESEDTRYPFSASVIGRSGHYEVKAPAGLPLRFLASKGLHRAVTFVETLNPSSAGDHAEINFTGARALDPILLKMGASSDAEP